MDADDQALSGLGGEPGGALLTGRYGTDVAVSFVASPDMTFTVVLDFGFSTIVSRDIEEAGELFEAFRLHQEEVVRFSGFSFTLAQVEDDPALGRRVIYTDKDREIRMSREEYDGAARAMTEMLCDPLAQAALDRTYRAVAAAQRADRPHAGSG